MRVLAINGSHRKGKNTATLLKIVLEEAQSLGAETELVELVDYNIKPCAGCNQCLRVAKCSVEDDDMHILVQKLLQADGIVLGSPVYFANVTGLMKIFMDRTRWLHILSNKLHGKVGAVVVHAGLRNGGQELTQVMMERFLAIHGIIVVDSRDPEKEVTQGALGTLFDRVEGDKVYWKKSVSEDIVVVKECRQLGRNLVRQIKLLRGDM